MVVACKEFGIEVNADKNKIMSRDQNAGRSHNIKTDNSSREKVEEFKYLGETLSDQNFIQEEIKSRVKSGNNCYPSVQKSFVFQFTIKNGTIKVHRTIILSVCLYGCGSWLLTLREERRLRVFENRALRRIFGPERAR